MECTTTDIGKRIIELRATRNLTQEQLAKALNIKREVVTKWENGTRDLKTGHTIALANYFQITCDELLRGVRADHVNINEATGLSSAAIDKIRESLCPHPHVIQLFNAMIIGDGFNEILNCLHLAIQKEIEIAEWGNMSMEQNVLKVFTSDEIDARVASFLLFNQDTDKSDHEIRLLAMDVLNMEIIDKLRNESDMFKYKVSRLFDKLTEKMLASHLESIQKKRGYRGKR